MADIAFKPRLQQTRCPQRAEPLGLYAFSHGMGRVKRNIRIKLMGCVEAFASRGVVTPTISRQ